MKFCQECGTQLNDTANFCVKCGTPCAAVNGSSIVHNSTTNTDYSRYYGMSFRDSTGKILELTPHGVYIHRHTGFFSKFDNLIPYKHIIHINLTQPSFFNGNGSLTFVTANSGQLKNYSLKERHSRERATELCENQNVISFSKMPDIQPIYDALMFILYG